MIKFNKPEKLNGSQLLEELKSGEIKIGDSDFPLIDGNGNFWLNVSEKDFSKAETIVNNHIGRDTVNSYQIKKTALLERLGITEEEARLLLG